jgi:hypothetical protein
MIEDMKFRLRLNFVDARVVYAPRSCNKPAHELAAWSVQGGLTEHVIWTTDLPTSVTRLVTGDLSVS